MNRRIFGSVFAVLFFLLVAVLYFAWNWWPSTEHHRAILDGLLGGILGAALTLLLAYIAWRQLGSLSWTASAQFIMGLKRDFFSEDTRLLFQLIDANWLEFVHVENTEAEFFRIREAEINESRLDASIIERLTRKKVYATYDVDDCLLGHFEDIGFLQKAAILDIEMVYQEFSYYILAAWDNRDICKYIKAQREGSPEDEDLYEHFEYIAKMLRKWAQVRRCIFARFSLWLYRL